MERGNFHETEKKQSIDLKNLHITFCDDEVIEKHISEQEVEIGDRDKWIAENSQNIQQSMAEIKQAVEDGVLTDAKPETIWEFKKQMVQQNGPKIKEIRNRIEIALPLIVQEVEKKLAKFLPGWQAPKVQVFFKINKDANFCIDDDGTITADLARLVHEQDPIAKVVEGVAHELFHLWMQEGEYSQSEKEVFTVNELKERIVYSTFNEGLAVLVSGQPLESFHQRKGGNYRQYCQESLMFFEQMLASENSEQIKKMRKTGFENMGNCYVAGNEMAKAILDNVGIDRFRELMEAFRKNPQTMLEEYKKIQAIRENMGENVLLSEPEKAQEEDKILHKTHFGFNLFNTRFCDLYYDSSIGESIIMKFISELPNSLTELEKAKFSKERQIINGEEKDVYLLKIGSHGESSDLEETKMSKPTRYTITERRNFTKVRIHDFLNNNENRKILADIISRHTNNSAEEIAIIANQMFDGEQGKKIEKRKLLENSVLKKVIADVELFVEQQQKNYIEIEKVAEILRNKKILFYSGAGISIAGGVPAMQTFKRLHKLDQDEGFDELAKTAVSNPDEVLLPWKKFIDAASNNGPTPAHIAMTAIAQKMGCKVFTENVDRLHEKTGIQALRPNGDWLRQHIEPKWLKEIDTVVTVGLSTDDRGFLAWYKEHNPKGKIIAINIDFPNYLGDEDFLLRGDVQEILPKLKEMVG